MLFFTIFSELRLELKIFLPYKKNFQGKTQENELVDLKSFRSK